MNIKNTTEDLEVKTIEDLKVDLNKSVNKLVCTCLKKHNVSFAAPMVVEFANENGHKVHFDAASENYEAVGLKLTVKLIRK